MTIEHPVEVSDPWLKPSTAADYAQCCVETLLRAARHGTLQGVKLGRVWRFRRSAVDAFLDAQAWPAGRDYTCTASPVREHTL